MNYPAPARNRHEGKRRSGPCDHRERNRSCYAPPDHREWTAAHAARDRLPRHVPNRQSATGSPEPAPDCCIRPRSRRQRSRLYNARCCADLRADALVLANSRISSRTSFGPRSEKMSAIHVSCSAAILRNSARPVFVSRITCTRRSDSEVRRSTWPESTRRSTSPVTLPLDTIVRFETSDSVMPSGTLSSWAIRSNLGSVTSNRSRNRLRTSPSMRVVQVRRRSHNLSSSPWSSGSSTALVSESRIMMQYACRVFSPFDVDLQIVWAMLQVKTDNFDFSGFL